MIARGLTNRDGKPWVMRRRTQAEMDELVRAAGFEKIAHGDRPVGHLHGRRWRAARPERGDVARAVGPVRRRLRGDGLAHVPARRRGDVVLRLGTEPPAGAVLIVPYMSIDLFFFAAPFLCADAGSCGRSAAA